MRRPSATCLCRYGARVYYLPSWACQPDYADAVPFGQNVTFFFGKADIQLGSHNRLALRYNGHRNDSPYNSSNIGGLYLVDRTYNFVDRSHGGAAQLIIS